MGRLKSFENSSLYIHMDVVDVDASDFLKSTHEYYRGLLAKKDEELRALRLDKVERLSELEHARDRIRTLTAQQSAHSSEAPLRDMKSHQRLLDETISQSREIAMLRGQLQNARNQATAYKARVDSAIANDHSAAKLLAQANGNHARIRDAWTVREADLVARVRALEIELVAHRVSVDPASPTRPTATEVALRSDLARERGRTEELTRLLMAGQGRGDGDEHQRRVAAEAALGVADEKLNALQKWAEQLARK